MTYDKVKYNTEYNKANYTEMRFRVSKTEKPIIDQHWKRKGYDSFSAYMKDLIRKDMNENIEQNTKSINAPNNNGIALGDNNTISGNISIVNSRKSIKKND